MNIKIAFFNTYNYDKIHFDKLNTKYEIIYFEEKLNENTAILASGCSVVVAFVNDDINSKCVDILYKLNIKLIALRSAGYSNVDFESCFGKIHVVRVPAYSPNAVSEHALALLLSLNRKIHKAYNRTRDYNFNLTGLMGIDLYNKTLGVIGTGKIGKCLINACLGLGMKVICYDVVQNDPSLNYVSLDKLFQESDVISLHCPLNSKTHHLLNKEAFDKMKKGIMIINTSRGALINTTDLIDALNNEIVRGVGLDVYEEEEYLFFEDFSNQIIKDDVLSLLLSKPNVILTSHQGFLTEEALENIAKTTLKNIDDYFSNTRLENEICYRCDKKDTSCIKKSQNRCF